MSKSYRIRTKPGENGYLNVNLDLNQNYDFLEILSLKISQKDEYKDFCAEYGVIAGRIDVNGGFGIPNAKVSIFVPLDEADIDNPIISSLYPYGDLITDPDKRNSQGLRYNLLPSQQNKLDHTPVGTFPSKRQVLENGTTLEMYEKYYKYTTTTNDAGDYILFGVPTGEHTIHYDVDISDIGFASARPYELIAEGYSEELFDSKFKFRSSNNIDTLPQIFTANEKIMVEPYWCDNLSGGSPLGINRKDFSVDVNLVPTAIFTGSIFSDDEKDSLNKNCRPDRDMGKMVEVITGGGTIEAIRRTQDGNIEKFEINGEAIDENGNWSIMLPMNLRKVITDEFGNLIPSPDGVVGIPTEADFRFRIAMDKSGTDKRLRQRAHFLVPNLTGNYNFKEYNKEDLENSDDFKINEQLSIVTLNTPYEDEKSNEYNYLEDFFTFRWKKVYTVKQYIGRFQKGKRDENRGFIGIKDILQGEGVNKFPSNRVDTNFNPIYSILCLLLGLFASLVGIINGLIQIINGLITMICQVRFPVGLCVKLEWCMRLGIGNKSNSNYKASFNRFNCSGTSTYGTNKCQNNSSCTKKSTVRLNVQLKMKCLFSGLFCRKCNGYCPGEQHGCCSNPETKASPPQPELPYQYNFTKCPAECGSGKCCGDCCIKVPLISLSCPEDNVLVKPALLATPFAALVCNRTFVLPKSCVSCGGLSTPLIKDWVACKMEPIAVWLKMLKFDFYNDWVNGTLYFPLIKRKFKLKTNKKKFGQIKKDKFCQFNCYDEFQGNGEYTQNAIIIQPSATYGFSQIEVSGCKVNISAPIATDWFGDVNTNQNQNLDKAAQSITLNGRNASDDLCQIKFDSFSALNNSLSDYINAGDILIDDKSKQSASIYAEPNYVKVTDEFGNTTWENQGGFGLNKNRCDRTRMLERKEFFKTNLDCEESSSGLGNFLDFDNLPDDPDGGISIPPDDPDNAETPDEEEQVTGFSDPNWGYCIPDDPCGVPCGANGVSGCNLYCPCNNFDTVYDNYTDLIRHGLITWEDRKLYYSSIIRPSTSPYSDDDEFNNDEYKANLMLPTTITELGSTTFCDLDGAPFIMDTLQPTTFQVSMESTKYKFDTSAGSAGNKVITDTLDREGGLNLRAYVSLSCSLVECMNTFGIVNQSQIGVEMIDTNDIDVAVGPCYLRFSHDVDVREYFCRRFSGYKDGDLNVHYIRPGGDDLDNKYDEYPEMKLTDGLTYEFDNSSLIGGLLGTNTPNEIVPSEYNDNEFFVPGDACGFKKDTSGNVDYFYGLAPGRTDTLTNFPNSNISFTTNSNDIENIDINENDFTDVADLKGIRFNRSQTPYHFYFGLVPGKTSLHKTVGKFFADKINTTTLQGMGLSPDETSANEFGQNNIRNQVDSPFSIMKTCLGQTQLPKPPIAESDTSS